MAAQAKPTRVAPKRSTQSKPQPQQVNSPIHFRVQTDNLNAHLFEVTLHINHPAAIQRVSLPVWIPGSYLVREFSKHLQALTASQAGPKSKSKGEATLATDPTVHQVDKCTWDITCNPAVPLTLRYQVYALDNSVRTAWLDSTRGFFNGTSMFLRVQEQTQVPHAVQIDAPAAAKQWELVTGLPALKTDNRGFGSYLAAHYDELADCPVEMGSFWRGDFKAHGVKHTFVVAGATPSFDGARLLADTKKICEAEIAFWHGAHIVSKGKAAANGPQHQNYVFMLNAVDDGYGGLEHRNSTALICNRKDLPRLGGGAFAPVVAKESDAKLIKQPEGYTTLLGLISHEYFHTWNVKRLRPAEFAHYNYGHENYTALLWFFEGFTSYYDDLLLRRAGLIDDAAYLKLLNKTINQVMQTPGRLVQSVAQASLDAWVKYYRQDENTPNATVSYYTKGSLVALCLDLTLRTEGKTTLDAVMRALWLRCQGGPMTEADLADELAHLGGRSFAPELAHWVHSTVELPVLALLQQHGVTAAHDPSQIAQVLGLRVTETHGVQIKTVLRGGAAEAAGFQSGDEWLAVQADADVDASTRPTWRVQRLDELLLYVGQTKQLTAWVARDKKIIPLSLTVPSAQTTVRLTVHDAKRVSAWLA